jgi:DNA-directed RNA polymerase subunit RPC12/RpoP
MDSDSKKDYFLCDRCKSKDFVRIYNFSVRFRSVNFSDDLMYDQVVEEIYQCTHCQKIFSKPNIDAELRKWVDERVESVVPTKEGS